MLSSLVSVLSTGYSVLSQHSSTGGTLTGTAADWIWLAVALPFLGFLVNGTLAFLRPRAKTVVSVVGAGVMLLAFALSVMVFLAVRAAHPETPHVVSLWEWLPVGSLQVAFAFQVDQLSTVMLLVVTGVGSLIHLFSIGYMHEDEGYARYFAYLNLFVTFMLVLVLGANFPMMFIGWEGVGLCSYLLIGFWYSVKANADAGKKAFIVNRIGDFGFLIAMFLIWTSVGSLNFTDVFERAPGAFQMGSPVITAITLFLLLGCTGKSAQIPLYTWLPDAMAGPTPVSALIHAATMVTAGVYLVARTNILFTLAPTSSLVTAGIGALTALFAATIGLRQYDIKKVLAYSTVSQLGYMFLGVGAAGYTAGIFHLVTHAFFKALLFLGAGSVIHALHHAFHATHSHEDAQDMRNMGGLRHAMPWTFALMGLATLAIAGIPPLSGFFSKDEILALAFARGTDHPAYYAFYAMGLLAAGITAFYMARLMAMTFFGESRLGENEREHLHEAPWIMTGPLVVLGILAVIGGAINLPPIIGGTQGLHHWLAPLLARSEGLLQPHHLSHATEYALIAAAVLVGVTGLVLGFRATLARPITPAATAPAERGVGRLIFNKYYVDELYDRLVVRPLVWLSRVVLWQQVDAKLVDGVAVNGASRASRVLGRFGSLLQTGYVGVYVVAFLLGALWILYAVVP
jgi:NADH-quinone oxidoreductase subunit L